MIQRDEELTHLKCSMCGEKKTIDNFRKRYGKQAHQYDLRCNKCFNEYVRGKYNYERERDKQLRQNYGITLDEYNKLLDSQNGVCAVCGNPESRRPGRKKLTENVTPMLHVDHDHKTGKIRGLLCSECNNSLGMLHEDPERIKALLKYVECQGEI